MSDLSPVPLFKLYGSVQEVVDWLISEGFDQDVFDKFIG